ncbi:hypothetical protein [Mucilaginibacter dorajii]|uniref:Uncharacterized protein n=1 Tax=Mucilaginibacter dorajii TaxID=692994 RepID=A0ABP7PX20_9SPHI|nr:hypothetical protein [Mucilaginibacter dorajii]MCS3737258.1 hypothetical protein [Mucilaginibacter dorajii]
MKPKLFSCLFLFLNLSCYAVNNSINNRPDTTNKIIKSNLKVKHREPGVSYSRESFEGYKPWFDNCVFTNKYTIQQRLKMYPYSKAVKVLAVSYAGNEVSAPSYKGHITGKKALGLVIHQNQLDYSTLIEHKVMDFAAINRLTEIIFNTDYKVQLKDFATMGHTCYEPHNAFIFLNKEGKVIDFLEICFECKQYRSMHNKLTVGEYCTQKFDMLKRCFIDQGVNYGTLKDPWQRN